MSKSKEETGKNINTPAAKPPFMSVSRFGKQSLYGNQKFTPKGISVRPTFVTQHKGGGGK